MPTIASLILGAVLLSSGSTAPTASTSPRVNKAVQNNAEAQALWETLLDGFGRIKGEIVIREELRPYVNGKCSDFIVMGYKAPYSYDEDPRGTTRAYGNIATGKCSYMLFIEPTREVSMKGQFAGTLDPEAPGDVQYVSATTSNPKRVWAGKTRTANFELRPGYIG